jgi:hypothetical protein
MSLANDGGSPASEGFLGILESIRTLIFCIQEWDATGNLGLSIVRLACARPAAYVSVR